MQKDKNKEHMDRIAQEALDAAREATWSEVATLTTYLLSETMPEEFAEFRKNFPGDTEADLERAIGTPGESCRTFLENTILPMQNEVLAAVLRRAAELATAG